ncbi:DUF4038 domain-containing protein [Mucilaginibacter limnophilus]|uniref:DUF4038 domain-containing protein n=2 Tax=Mucilaginibacter limnophilus TaxID=1932778 RepID=A0A437MZZ6_9SPHI|nr:DUF4038 domain-containing protein [Mucilaginibacter limnophilus]
MICLAFTCSFVQAQHLVVKPSSTIIETSDGKHFLWLGDTAWDLFIKLNKQQINQYLDNRKDNGFTVIQAAILGVDGTGRKTNAYNELPFTKQGVPAINEKYFKRIDEVIDEAGKRGLYMALLPTWAAGIFNKEGKSSLLNTQTAYEYGRLLGKRYRDKPVIWILGGDRNVQTDNEYEIWNAMAKGITETNNGQNLITYHPTAPVTSSYWFHNQAWLSFNGIQTGHERKFNPVYEFAAVFSQSLPLKPYVNLEPAYEDIAVQFWKQTDYAAAGKTVDDVIGNKGLIKDTSFFKKGFFDGYDIRMEAYWTFFAGGAGYTYGNNAIWQMYRPGDKYEVAALHYWNTALNRPGATAIKYMRQLFTQYPLGSFHIDQSVIYGANFYNDEHIRAVVANNNSFLLIYLNKGQSVRVVMNKLQSSGEAYWFNPRNGEKQLIGKIENTGIKTFNPPKENTPAGNDWILILQSSQTN